METKRSSVKEWFENIWYHYKWLIILGLIVVLTVTFTLPQICNKNEDADINLLYVGKTIDSTFTSELCESAAKFTSDRNGDGKTDADIRTITINKAYDTEGNAHYGKNTTEDQQFEVEVRTGDSYIYIIDKNYFDKCVEYGLLVKISDIIDDADMPKETISDMGIKISDLNLSKMPGFEKCDPDSILCFRRFVNDNEVKYGRTEEDWKHNRRAFINMVKYRAEKAE